VEEVIPEPDILSLAEVHALADLDTDIDDPTFCKIFGANQLKWLNDMESVFAARENSNSLFGGWPRGFFFDELDDEEFETLKSGCSIVKTFCAFVVANEITSLARACAEGDITEAEFGGFFAYVGLILILQCGRHTFRTSSGRLGYAPLPVSPGDSICFIPDGRLLHVLSHDCTRHVALATVEGFMDDDLLKIVPTDKSQWQEFHLS
jgi:hypothetical protein